MLRKHSSFFFFARRLISKNFHPFVSCKLRISISIPTGFFFIQKLLSAQTELLGCVGNKKCEAFNNNVFTTDWIKNLLFSIDFLKRKINVAIIWNLTKPKLWSAVLLKKKKKIVIQNYFVMSYFYITKSISFGVVVSKIWMNLSQNRYVRLISLDLFCDILLPASLTYRKPSNVYRDSLFGNIHCNED